MCTFRTIAASYLRSLSRAEMVVRRRPLSLLDSAVAIWYSSFSMEKGLAMRRHFRSCTQIQNWLQTLILIKSVTVWCVLLCHFFMSRNQKRRHFFLNIGHLFNQFCFLFSEVYTHPNTYILTRWRKSKASWLTCSNNVDNVLQRARMKLFAV